MGIKRHGVGEKTTFEHDVRRSEEKINPSLRGEEEEDHSNYDARGL